MNQGKTKNAAIERFEGAAQHPATQLGMVRNRQRILLALPRLSKHSIYRTLANKLLQEGLHDMSSLQKLLGFLQRSGL